MIAGATSRNEYLYNGKEVVDELGLGWYHYGVRYYDTVLARWVEMDPADQFHSPYSYVGGDPVNLIDPYGRQAFEVQMDETVVTAEAPEAHTMASIWVDNFNQTQLRNIQNNDKLRNEKRQAALLAQMYQAQQRFLYESAKAGAMFGGILASGGQGAFYAYGARGLVSSAGYLSMGFGVAQAGFQVYEGKEAGAIATGVAVGLGYGRTGIVQYADESMGTIRGFGDLPYRLLGINSVAFSQGAGYGVKKTGSEVSNTNKK